MRACLVTVADNRSIPLDKPIVLIGRDSECDIQLESRKISRIHCCIAVLQHGLIVRDLGSTNGIRINGNPVTEGRLEAGDELMIGGLLYRVDWREEAKERAQPPSPAKPAAAPIDPASASSSPLPAGPLEELPDLELITDTSGTGNGEEATGRKDSSLNLVLDPSDPLIQRSDA